MWTDPPFTFVGRGLGIALYGHLKREEAGGLVLLVQQLSV